MSQHAFVEIIEVEINRVIFEPVPGPDMIFFSVHSEKFIIKLSTISITLHRNLFCFSPHIQNFLNPFKKEVCFAAHHENQLIFGWG